MALAEVEPKAETLLVGPWKVAEIPAQWDRIASYIDGANRHSSGRYSAVATFEALLQGQMQLWTIESKGKMVACVVTEIVTYPSGMQALSFVTVTGKQRKEWLDAWLPIAEWGWRQGCDLVESWARKGWAREMAQFGWTESHRLIERDLNDLAKRMGWNNAR